MPITGAIIAEAVIALPDAPINGNRFQEQKIVYNGAKTATNARSLVESLGSVYFG